MNERFNRAIARIDAENAQDPRHEIVNGEAIPQELLYSRRLTEWVLRLNPNASEALRLAARAQHICRWKIPRTQYPATKAGYHQWKNDLKRLHADIAERILAECGYDREAIEQVRALNLKEKFPEDAESRTLEDALCLVFLEYQFDELAQKSSPEKVINALRKSWNKMTSQARDAAMTLSYNAVQTDLLRRALQPGQVLS